MPTNNFTSLYDSVLSYDLIDEFNDDLRPLLNLAHDFGNDDSDIGTVKTVTPGSTVDIIDFKQSPTAYTVDPDVGYSATAASAPAKVSFTLPNSVIAVSQSLTSEEYRILTGAPHGKAYDKLREKMRQGCMRSLKEQLISDFYDIITVANYPTETVIATGTFSRSKDIDLDTTLFGRNLMDRSNATGIITKEMWGEYSKDHLAIMDNTGENQRNRVMAGPIQSRVTDFDYWRSNVAMPDDADRGVVFTKTAAVMVSRVPDEAAMSVEQNTIDYNILTDPESGFSVLQRAHVNRATGGIQIDYGVICKFQKLQAEALERIVAVATP